MDGLAVGADRGDHDLAVLIPHDRRRLGGHGAPLDGRGMGRPGVIDPQGQIPYPVPMPVDMVGDGPALVAQVGPDRGGQHEADLVLLQEVAGPVPDPGFGPPVADQLKAERGAVVQAGLLRVANPELDVIRAVDREGVGGRGGGGQGVRLHGDLRGRRCHNGNIANALASRYARFAVTFGGRYLPNMVRVGGTGPDGR